jgi:hypothetical protein
MRTIGKVKYIINDKYLLAEINLSEQSSLKYGDILEIVGKVTLNKKKKDLSEFYFPKGRLRVLNKQPGNEYYLLESKTETVKSPSWILNSLNPLEEVYSEKEVPAEDAPKMAKEESLGVRVDRKVHVGDSIIKSEGKSL